MSQNGIVVYWDGLTRNNNNNNSNNNNNNNMNDFAFNSKLRQQLLPPHLAMFCKWQWQWTKLFRTISFGWVQMQMQASFFSPPPYQMALLGYLHPRPSICNTELRSGTHNSKWNNLICLSALLSAVRLHVPSLWKWGCLPYLSAFQPLIVKIYASFPS